MSFFQTIYHLEQELRQNGEPELLKSFHSDIKGGHAFNSLLGILQAVSSPKPYVLLRINLTTRRLIIDKIILFRYQDGQELNSNLDISLTTSSSKHMSP